MTEITADGKAVKKLSFHFAGEDGDMMWVGFEFEDGTTMESFYFKGTL